MKSTISRFARIALALLVATAAAGPLYSMQESGSRDRGDANERLTSLLERLEVGVSALEELEQAELAEQVDQVADRLRERLAYAARERAGERGSDEAAVVRRRLRVMRSAVEAYLRADRRDAAELVEHAMHARELNLERRRDDEANRIRESAPDRAQLAEALAGAARLYAEWEQPERARALEELSGVFAEQWRQRQLRAQRGEVAERVRGQTGGLERLETRVEVLRLGHAALRRSRAPEMRELEAALHYGELALEGADEGALAQAAGAVPARARLGALLERAASNYREWGRSDEARRCAELAELYAADENGGSEQRLPAREVEPTGLDDRARRMEILEYAHLALARAGHEEWADVMARFLRVGALELQGADPEEVLRAFEGLSMGMAIELLQKSSGIYAEFGIEDRAEACHELAEFYAARERAEGERAAATGQAGAGDRRGADRDVRSADEYEERLLRMLERLEQLSVRLEAIQAEIERRARR